MPLCFRTSRKRGDRQACHNLAASILHHAKGTRRGRDQGHIAHKSNIESLFLTVPLKHKEAQSAFGGFRYFLRRNRAVISRTRHHLRAAMLTVILPFNTIKTVSNGVGSRPKPKKQLTTHPLVKRPAASANFFARAQYSRLPYPLMVARACHCGQMLTPPAWRTPNGCINGAKVFHNPCNPTWSMCAKQVWFSTWLIIRLALARLALPLSIPIPCLSRQPGLPKAMQCRCPNRSAI